MIETYSSRWDAVRHPKRGKAHRVLGANSRPWEAAQDRDISTRCGKWARDMTERIELRFTAPEDRCRTCWPASPAVPVAPGAENEEAGGPGD